MYYHYRKNMPVDNLQNHSVRRRHVITKERLEYNYLTSSSSNEEDRSPNRSVSVSSTQSVSESGHHRRRKRRKPGSRQRISFIKSKALSIEKALIYMKDDLTDSLSSSGVNKDSPSPKKEGKDKLKELAITESGLINDDFRRKVWPRLLDINMVCI